MENCWNKMSFKDPPNKTQPNPTQPKPAHSKFLFCLSFAAGGNQDGKFSVGFRDGVVRTVVSLDRETVASYTLILEAIGKDFPGIPWEMGWLCTCRAPLQVCQRGSNLQGTLQTGACAWC